MNKIMRKLAEQHGMEFGQAREFERTFRVEHADDVNTESRTVDLSFSSEEPVERWFGNEILDHSAGSVNLGRLQDGAAVLVNHDADQHVGVVESVEVDGKQRKGRAVVRFGKSEQASRVLEDIRDGIRSHVSVGYRINDLVLEEQKNGEIDTYRATDWTPHEISIVAVPADAGVGIGRNFNEDSEMKTDEQKRQEAADVETKRIADETAQRQVDADAETQRTADAQRATDDALKSERERNIGITAIANEHPIMRDAAAKAIEDGVSIDAFRATALEALKGNNKPTRFDPPTGMSMAASVSRTKKLKAFDDSESAYRSGMWALGAFFGNERALSWCRDNMSERVMSTMTNTKGGAVVPEEMSQAIIDLRETYGVARQSCRVMPMSSDTLVIPRRVGGITAYYVDETTATTASDKSWDNVTLTAKKLAALTRYSTDLAEDAVIDIGDDLASEFAWAFAAAEDDALFNGDGTSTYGGIEGVRPKLVDGNHTAGAKDATAGTNTFAEIDADDLATLMSALPQYALPNAHFYCSQVAFSLVFEALAAAAGGNTISMQGDAVQYRYLGYPITISQKMPTSTGDLENLAMILFGDMSMAATLGDRRGFSATVLNERYAEFDQLGILGTERYDINVHDLGDTSTGGPIVGLIGA